MITQDRLIKFLHYNPSTGVFTRTLSVGSVKSGAIVGVNLRGYLITSIDGHNHFLHRLAWLYVHGELPKRHIDHINGKKNDNRLSNLREADDSQNMQNQKSPQSGNKSGFIGVTKHSSGKWAARIKSRGIVRNLGLFTEPSVAYEAYIKAKREMHEYCTL